jgi:hypothetical protein
VNRNLLILVLMLVVASSAFAIPAMAEEDPTTDYCSKRTDMCLYNCSSYNVTLFGLSVPTPRTGSCVLECGVAYAGCLMMRFHQGV